jgi:hypothetical protein
MAINKSVNTILPINSLPVNDHLVRLRMNPVKSYETLEIWLHPLRLATPDINTKLTKLEGFN